MNFKRFFLLLLALTLVIALASCNGGDDNKCESHVDADDNYLCDKCGEHFDDGDETENNETATGVSVTFVVKFDGGETLSGVKFTLTRGDKVYSLESGTDGKVNATVDLGVYEVDVLFETLPEYCWTETYGLKVEEGTETLEIIIVDNTPNGSAENPFWINENETPISVAPGEEIFFNYRGSTVKNVTIESDKLVINFNGNSYSAVDGVVYAQISPAEIGQITIFSIKNVSDSVVDTTLKAYAPLGSEENPFELTGNTATAAVTEDQSLYYIYKAEKDGVLLLVSPTEGNSISVTRNVIKYVEGLEEPIIIPILAQTNGGSAIYAYVKEGEEIKISVSYVGDSLAEDKTHDVEFTVNIYAGTEEDAVPVFGEDAALSIDAGASVVFVAAADGEVVINAAESVTVSLNGELLTPEANGKYGLDVKAYDKFTVVNNSGEISVVGIEL